MISVEKVERSLAFPVIDRTPHRSSSRGLEAPRTMEDADQLWTPGFAVRCLLFRNQR